MKEKDNIYTTLLGGYSWYEQDKIGKIILYDRYFLYGRMRICYDTFHLKDGWIHRSLHWNNFPNGGITWNFHIAYRNKFPFIKIGFNSIKDLFDG